MFAIRAKARITRVLKGSDGFSKTASLSIRAERNLLDPDIFHSISGAYSVSPDPKSYLYLVARAVTANVPNANGDMFPEDELLRFDTDRSMCVYETFRNVPLHQNHQASDPKAARGFILDAHFNRQSDDDHYVELVVAADISKDKGLAEDLESGRKNSFSMGCLAATVKCSICDQVATKEAELCVHLRSAKMQQVGSKLCYEECRGVTYTEFSIVPDPADKTALTQALLGKVASRKRPVISAVATKTPVVETLGIGVQNIHGIHEFFRSNINLLPESMIVLGEKLFSVR
jgi:hypothetical protein